MTKVCVCVEEGAPFALISTSFLRRFDLITQMVFGSFMLKSRLMGGEYTIPIRQTLPSLLPIQRSDTP